MARRSGECDGQLKKLISNLRVRVPAGRRSFLSKCSANDGGGSSTRFEFSVLLSSHDVYKEQRDLPDKPGPHFEDQSEPPSSEGKETN